MISLRCNNQKCHRLLMKVRGRDYEIEVVCKKCRHKSVFTSETPPAMSRLEEVVFKSPVSVRTQNGGKPRAPRVPEAESNSHGR